MKLALAQLNYHVGNFEYNTQKIIDAIASSKSKGVDLIVFSELAICGYPPRDLLEYDFFIESCEQSIHKIIPHCDDIAVIIGMPTRNQAKGKSLFNSACFISEGTIQQRVHKTLLPSYDIFDEDRYFQTNNDNYKLIEYKGEKFGITICEDVWFNDQYLINPLRELAKLNPNFLINISGSPFSYNHSRNRKEVLKKGIQDHGIPIYYVNQVGANTDIIFDGGSMFVDKELNLSEMKYFEEDIQFFDTQNSAEKPKLKAFDKFELLQKGIELGIKDYFQKSGFYKSIIGLSGGIDSALTTVLATNALGADNVLCVLMPSKWSSDHSVSDSIALIERLGIKHELVEIHQLYDQYLDSLQSYFEGHDEDITEENIQSRIRGNILMAFSNKFGHILLNTTNKSEMATGYGTLYGDMCGGLSVLGDLYKTEVYGLSNFINREAEIIPANIITKPPSAELKPDQKDSDTLPDYDVLDAILFAYIDQKKSTKEIISEGYDNDLVERVIRMVNLSEYKRHQTAPILRVSEKAFGGGRRIPIIAKNN